MLYLNAYRVRRAFGGREEGGWWFDMGEPLASIPIKTELSRGQTYVVSDGDIHLTPCTWCGGSGFVTLEGDDGPSNVRCEDCGEIPFDVSEVTRMIATYVCGARTRVLVLSAA